MKKTTAICRLGAVSPCVSCGQKAEKNGSITEFSGSFVEKGRPVADFASHRIAYYEPVEGVYRRYWSRLLSANQADFFIPGQP